MTTTQSTAKINAIAAVKADLVALGATNIEQADAMAKWVDLTSGRRPGYYAAHCKVVDEFRAEKGLPVIERAGVKAAPAPTAPVVDEQAFEAAAPTDAPLTAKEQAKVDAKFAAAKVAKTKADAKATRAAADKKAAKVPTAPKAEKVPARKVETVKNAPGQFLRQRRLVRRTKSVVAIFDLSHADAAAAFGQVFLPGTETPAKYLVVDEDHGQQIAVKNYESAWRIALTPAEFCTACPKG